MLEKVAIILQGPTNYLDKVIPYYNPFLNTIIVSTWENEPVNYNIKDIHLIENKKPQDEGIGNLNLQTISTFKGIELAKKLEFKYVFKCRSDIYFDIIDINYIFDALDGTKLNFLCWHNHDGGYLVDYMCFGPIEEMEYYWNYTSNDRSRSADIQLSNRYNKKVGYILPILLKYNINCYWLKYGINLKDYSKDPKYIYENI